MKISARFNRMADIYRRFAPSGDFSLSALQAQYTYESNGGAKPDDSNGYALGKKWMDVQVEMWRTDIKAGLLFRHELEADYPAWFLDKVLAGANTEDYWFAENT